MAKTLLDELFQFTDWARDRLFDLARPLSDARLDQSFEMGPGSIRAALHHIAAAEKIWLERWTRGGVPKFDVMEPGLSLNAILALSRETAAARNDLLAQCDAPRLAARMSFTTLKGENYSLPLAGQMLHVANHGVHHRAQIVNMLRQLSAEIPKPGLDYIFFRLETPASPELELDSLRRYQAYADWGTRALVSAGEGLTDDHLDRPFAMGLETYRKTLCHLCDAEDWWHHNWTRGPAGEFPKVRTDISINELSQRLDSAWKRRDEFMATLKPADLTRQITVKPRPDMTLQFPLGVSMLQLCVHATHHRAQAVNMLRRMDQPPPSLDLILWLRDRK